MEKYFTCSTLANWLLLVGVVMSIILVAIDASTAVGTPALLLFNVNTVIA